MCADEISYPSCTITNIYFKSGVYPNAWKCGEIVSIEKNNREVKIPADAVIAINIRELHEFVR